MTRNLSDFRTSFQFRQASESVSLMYLYNLLKTISNWRDSANSCLTFLAYSGCTAIFVIPYKPVQLYRLFWGIWRSFISVFTYNSICHLSLSAYFIFPTCFSFYSQFKAQLHSFGTWWVFKYILYCPGHRCATETGMQNLLWTGEGRGGEGSLSYEFVGSLSSSE